MECVHAEDDSKRWALEFEVRNQKAEQEQQQELHPRLAECKELIARIYSGNKKERDQKRSKLWLKIMRRNSANVTNGTSSPCVNYLMLSHLVVSVVAVQSNTRRTGCDWLASQCAWLW